MRARNTNAQIQGSVHKMNAGMKLKHIEILAKFASSNTFTSSDELFASKCQQQNNEEKEVLEVWKLSCFKET